MKVSFEYRSDGGEAIGRWSFQGMIFQGKERAPSKEQQRSRVSEGERNQKSLRLETRIL